jgi:hypothetical protein
MRNVGGVRKVNVNSRNAGSKPSCSEPKLQNDSFYTYLARKEILFMKAAILYVSSILGKPIGEIKFRF